ncbi:hypothetical protein VN1222_03310 [Helicobacter pylori]|nr:hypothetical protein VN1222_03310 [Helicobacter pylori]
MAMFYMPFETIRLRANGSNNNACKTRHKFLYKEKHEINRNYHGVNGACNTTTLIQILESYYLSGVFNS